MAWLAKDANGAEYIYDEQPTRKLDFYRNDGDCVELPKGGILALLGRELTFAEGPVELLEITPKT